MKKLMRDIVVTDKQIINAFNGTNFGTHIVYVEQKRNIVAKAILKRVCGYRSGHTVETIMQDLGLTKTVHGKPTKAAIRWMYEQIKGHL